MKEKNSEFVMGYWEYSSIEELHRHTKLWLTNLAFWKDDLFFMANLLAKHYVFLTEKKLSEDVQKLEEKIAIFKKEMAAVEVNVEEHEKRLKRLIQLQGKKREEDYRREHGLLDRKFEDLVERYKSIKKEFIADAEAMLKEEKIQRMISSAG